MIGTPLPRSSPGPPAASALSSTVTHCLGSICPPRIDPVRALIGRRFYRRDSAPEPEAEAARYTRFGNRDS